MQALYLRHTPVKNFIKKGEGHMLVLYKNLSYKFALKLFWLNDKKGLKPCWDPNLESYKLKSYFYNFKEV